MTDPTPKLTQPQREALDLIRNTLQRRNARRERRGRGRWLRRVLLFALGVLVAFCLCCSSVSRAFRVSGSAMKPTLREGDRVIALTLAYKGGRIPGRGEIVLLGSPPQAQRDGMLLVKRVVGVPGDTVETRDGRLWRNGKIVDEPYLWERIGYAWGPVVCLPGHIIVLGDNRNYSVDSHNRMLRGAGGEMTPAPLLPVDLLRGKVVLIIYPPHRGRLFTRARAG